MLYICPKCKKPFSLDAKEVNETLSVTCPYCQAHYDFGTLASKEEVQEEEPVVEVPAAEELVAEAPAEEVPTAETPVVEEPVEPMPPYIEEPPLAPMPPQGFEPLPADNGFVPQPEERVEPEEPKNKKSKTGLWIFIGLLLAAAVIVILVLTTRNKSHYSGSSSSYSEDSSSASYLGLSSEELSYGYNGGSTTINVRTDGEWYVSSSPASWVNVEKNYDNVYVTVYSNNDGSTRYTSFTIRSGSMEKTVNITQKPEWTECNHCGGTGAKSCDYCSNGTQTCTHCNDGYMQCTNSNYMSMTDNTGRNVHGRNVAYTWYDAWGVMQIGYRGELCPTCNGSFRVVCSYCGGSGRMTCSHCGGSGETTCSWCDGAGEVRTD